MVVGVSTKGPFNENYNPLKANETVLFNEKDLFAQESYGGMI